MNFRLAARRHIPEVSAQRPKAGFKVPIRVWLREERYASLLREAFDRPYAGEFFDTDRLNHLLDEHIQGSANHARELYTVYAFLLWYEQYFILR